MNRLTKTEFKIMLFLQKKPKSYGLQIVEESNGEIKKGTIYVLLKRLMAKGCVEMESIKNPKRPGKPLVKYSITSSGEVTLKKHAQKHECKSGSSSSIKQS